MIIADREMVESSSDDILRDADKEDVAFLVVGDPYGYFPHPPMFFTSSTLNWFEISC